jgi:hypothetical protein
MISVVCLYPDRDPEAMTVDSTSSYIARTLGEGSNPTFLGSADNGGDTGVFLMGDAKAQRDGAPVDRSAVPPPFSTDTGPLRGMLIITKLRYHDEASLPTPIDYTMADYRRHMSSARCSH